MKVFKHGGKAGDIILQLPVIEQLGGGILKCWAAPFSGFGRESFEMLRPLLEIQPYISGTEWTEEGAQAGETDLDQWRWKHNRWLNLADLLADALNIPHYPRERAWLSVPDPIRVSGVLFARGPRYHNPKFPWRAVYEKYKKFDPVFVGHPEDHEDFQRWVGPIHYWHTVDYLALARVIAGCDMFVGNQSSPHAIAEGLKKPKILEVCVSLNNCHWERSRTTYILNGDEQLPEYESDDRHSSKQKTVAEAITICGRPDEQTVIGSESSRHLDNSVTQFSPSASPTTRSVIRYRFHHGLGDNTMHAHMLPLWIRRGFHIEIACDPAKAVLFRAAGAQIVSDAEDVHDFYHPPAPRLLKLHDGWNGNKPGWNLCQPPLPTIGTQEQLWDEFLQTRLTLEPFVTEDEKTAIDEFLGTIEGPLVLLHTRGDSAKECKDFRSELETETYRELLRQTDATLLLLDFDDRVARLKSRRVRHITDDFRRLSLTELWYLIERSALLIGIDSGPLSFTRFTNTPAIGVWFRHHPTQFAIPREKTAHVVTSNGDHQGWSRYRRHSFHVIEMGAQHTGKALAEQASRALAGRVGRGLVLAHLMDNVQQLGPASDVYLDRGRSFRLAMDALRAKDIPRIIETGCIRSEDDWTAGFSTYVLGACLQTHGGHLISVDVNENNVRFAQTWTRPFGQHVTIIHADSRDYLTNYTGPGFDLAYLDSADVDTPGYQEVCLREAELVVPYINPTGLILIDDSPWSRGCWTGSGAKAIPWLLARGWRIVYSGYQCLLRREL